MIIYCIVTAFFNTLAALVMGGAVMLRAPRRVENKLFACFAASFAAWSFFYLFWQLASTEEEALFYTRALTAASVFIPVTYFHFVSRLTSRRAELEIRLGYAAAVGVAVFAFSPHLVREVAPAMMFPYWPKPGLLFLPYLITFLYFVVRAWMVLFDALQTATHWHKRQVGYVLFGSVAGWLGGLTNLLLWFNIPVPPIGNGLSLAYIISVGYAMMQLRLADRNIFLVKGIVYLCVVAVMAMLYPVIVALLRAWVPAGMSEVQNVSEYVGAILITVALFVFVPRFTRELDAFLEEKAFGVLGDRRRRLREYIHSISTMSGLQTIYEETVNVVSGALKGTRVELFCRRDYEGDYGFQAGSTAGKSFFDQRRLTENDWVVRTTRSSGKALVLYEEERSVEASAGISECEQAGIELAIPIHADRLFYGLLLCGARRDKQLYSDLDISLLEAVCIQIGLTIRARELERRTNQTERLISLGTLAAGLAHELRNPLVSISTFTGLIAEQGADPEFRRQFHNVVDRDVKRIAAIIDQVGAFSNNADANFITVHLPQVIQDVYDIAKPELEKTGVTFTLEDDEALPSVRGNYSQLIQVFLNLVQNAIQAFTDSASPSIRVGFQTRRYRDGSPAIVVSVADNGPGIPAGIRSRIFDPFVTTKNTGERERDRGMGLGLGIVKCVVEAHGGTIDVASTAGEGTTFFVELPCEESRRIRSFHNSSQTENTLRVGNAQN